MKNNGTVTQVEHPLRDDDVLISKTDNSSYICRPRLCPLQSKRDWKNRLDVHAIGYCMDMLKPSPLSASSELIITTRLRPCRLA